MLNSSFHPSEQQHRQHYLKQLFYKHPLAFCTGFWTVFVLVGSVATVGLLSPGPIEQKASKPTPALTTVQDAKPKQLDATSKQDLPVSLFVVVVLGCAGGSLLLTSILKNSYQPPKRLKTATVRKKRRTVQKQATTPQTPSPASSELTVKTISNQLPQITVLPPEERHPLDSSDESLADMLDLRKRQSLASLMRGK